MFYNAQNRSSWKWPIFKFLATAAVWTVIAVIVVLGWYALGLPDVDDALKVTRRPTVTLLSADGSVFATRGDLYGVPVRVNNLPETLTEAIIATEDRRFYSHFGLDVDDRTAVDEAHKLVVDARKEYGIKKITKPVFQHGTYSFYIIDADDNWWEILENPKGGYNYVFDLKEDTRDWRNQNQGKTRVATGKRKITRKKAKKAA